MCPHSSKISQPHHIIAHLPRWHTIEEHGVNFVEGSAFKFGNIEERSDRPDHCEAAKDKADFSLQICFIRIDHVGNGSVHDDTKDCLSGCCEGGCFGSEGTGGRLTQDRESHGSNSQEVNEGIDDGEGCLHPFGGTSWDDIHNPNNEKNRRERDHAEEKDLSTPIGVDDKPGADVAEYSACCDADPEVECISGCKAGELEEICAGDVLVSEACISPIHEREYLLTYIPKRR
jgi:hypothetical protein